MPVVTKFGMYMLAVSPQHLNNILKTNKIVKTEMYVCLFLLFIFRKYLFLNLKGWK